LATRIRLSPPRDPEFKGLVERNNGYFETLFLPGRVPRTPARQAGSRAASQAYGVAGGSSLDLPEQTVDAGQVDEPGVPPVSGHVAVPVCGSTP
jgi:hypothetical protein